MKRGCINGCHSKVRHRTSGYGYRPLKPLQKMRRGDSPLQSPNPAWQVNAYLWLCMESHRLEYFICHSGFRSCNVMQKGYGGKTDPQIGGLANCRDCNASLQLSWLVNISPTSESRPWVGHRKAKMHATNDVCWLSPCWLPSHICSAKVVLYLMNVLPTFPHWAHTRTSWFVTWWSSY